MRRGRPLDPLDHRQRLLDRDREADVLGVLLARDRGVDADEPAGEVDERPARVTRVDRRIRLQQPLEPRRARRLDGAIETGDDAAGHRRPAEPERIADRDHRVAQAERRGTPDPDRDEIPRSDPDDREVALGRDTDHLAAQRAAATRR